MMNKLAFAVLAASAVMASACAPNPEPATSAVLPQAWLGKWTGPEGTFLTVTPHQGSFYRVDIQSLDSFNSYLAFAHQGKLTFTRSGVEETVRRTDGNTTGMKWLMGKTDCLTVKTGEGYCR